MLNHAIGIFLRVVAPILGWITKLKLGFGESPQAKYDSGSQIARVLTETWANAEMFCPNCGHHRLTKFPNNSPVADLYCEHCAEQFEIKSQKSAFGHKVADGAYRTMCERLSSNVNPNLILLNYSPTLGVKNLLIIPKHLFTQDIIEVRRPLAPTARRAGWIGCNILISRVPEIGKIYIVRDSVLVDKTEVLVKWQKMKFLQQESSSNRGWLLNVLKCVEDLGKSEFSLDEMYAFENRLGELFPMNRHVRQKIRQQLQQLRDRGLLRFVGRGRYQLSP